MAFDLNEPRYIKQSGLEARIARIVEPVANDLGYALVRVKLTQEHGLTLQVMAEDAEGRFTIADCERLSKELSPVLDVEDPIDREYSLEVSSPGIDRPLVRARDFRAHIGDEVKIELADMLEGRRRFRGDIAAVDDESVTIRLPDLPKGEEANHRLPLEMLADAKLVMTDALLNRASDDQQAHPIDDGEDIETVELNADTALDEDSAGQDTLDDPEAGSAEDAASQHKQEID